MSSARSNRSVVDGVVDGLPVHVMATTVEGTREALAAAGVFASAVHSRVYVIAQGIAPAIAEVESPTGLLRGFVQAIRDLPEAASAGAEVLPCFFRRPADLLVLLPRGAVVFVGGGSRRWWPTREQRLAHEFSRIGCRVVFIDTGHPAKIPRLGREPQVGLSS